MHECLGPNVHAEHGRAECLHLARYNQSVHDMWRKMNARVKAGIRNACALDMFCCVSHAGMSDCLCMQSVRGCGLLFAYANMYDSLCTIGVQLAFHMV